MMVTFRAFNAHHVGIIDRCTTGYVWDVTLKMFKTLSR